MKDLISERLKFFSLYNGQDVLYIGGRGIKKLGYGGWNLNHPDFFIILTPLTMVSEEHYVQVKLMEEAKTVNELIFAVDFLRSKGYALPWMGVSVEEQVKRRWIELKK
jgi:hypothetical protein